MKVQLLLCNTAVHMIGGSYSSGAEDSRLLRCQPRFEATKCRHLQGKVPQLNQFRCANRE
jgi:hypothetical protein